MAEIFDRSWKKTDILDKFEKGRKITSEALTANIERIYNKYVPSTGFVVELGSGGGALRDRIPSGFPRHVI